MESTDSSSCSQHPNLPPGFRFHPTDEELVVHYLKKKAASAPLPVTIIAEIDLYKFDPWELPSKATFGEQEWYFFSPRDRKYPNGARPNRAATSGYWKATGTDKPILTSNGAQKVGVKKALVFYGGKPPKGIKTNWIMHEYRLVDNNNNSSTRITGTDLGNKKPSSRLDDWVLCRIYKKTNTGRLMERDKDDSFEEMLASIPSSISMDGHQNLKLASFGGLLENDNHGFFEGIVNGDAIQSNIISQVGISRSKSDIPNIGMPMKRGFQSLYWNEMGSIGSDKRFHQADHNSSTVIDENGSFISLMNQIPQSGPFGPNEELGNLNQPYQLSAMNWNS